MTRKIVVIVLLLFPPSVHASTLGMSGFNAIKQCVMQNDIKVCHDSMTANSYAIFDRFSNYKLMPCLPTDFTYDSEKTSADKSIVKAKMPADNKTNYIFKMVFVKDPNGIKLDLPETLRVGLGETWQDKLNLSEQLFLMMRQNMQDKLSCDVLRDLVKPRNDKL